MKVINTVKKLKLFANDVGYKRNSIGFIPTMGALHDGHLSLIQKARNENDTVIVSIFVNPMQFNNVDDLNRYPRTTEQDIELIKEFADVVFVPGAEEIYPSGFNTTVHISPLADIGEGKYRPGHFDGMATVVLKLFNIVKPTRAYFGKKDYQQYVIVKQMVRDLNISTEIVGCETIREKNGLAMSSRNMKLSKEDLGKATIIYKALCIGKKSIADGERQTKNVKDQVSETLLTEPSWETEYIEIRSVPDFSENTEIPSKAVILIAGYIGGVRLIDNIEIGLS